MWSSPVEESVSLSGPTQVNIFGRLRAESNPEETPVVPSELDEEQSKQAITKRAEHHEAAENLAQGINKLVFAEDLEKLAKLIQLRIRIVKKANYDKEEACTHCHKLVRGSTFNRRVVIKEEVMEKVCDSCVYSEKTGRRMDPDSDGDSE